MKIGRYDVRHEIARGGMGVVYRAFDPNVGRDVAIKVLLMKGEARFVERFRREVAALGRMRHPHVVGVFDAGQVDGRPYLVMELLDGVTLSDRVEGYAPIPVAEAAQIARALADGLDHAHRSQVLHRDVKPSNVLLTSRGPVLTDFGLAKHQVAMGESARLSKSGLFLGSPGYWPPEQARGDTQAIAEASDIYGVGATLYAMLTGVPPCAGDTLIQCLAAVDGPVTPPSERRPAVDQALEAICMRCLEKRPEDRYPSAADLRIALDTYLRAEDRPPVRRSRAPAIGAAVASVAAVVVSLTWAATREPPVAPARADNGARPSPASGDSPDSEPSPASDIQDTTTQALWEQARDQVQAGDYPAALPLLDTVIARAPRSVDARVLRAWVQNIRNENAAAFADAKRALEIAPGHLHAYLQLLRAQHGLSKSDDRPTHARIDAEIAVRIAGGLVDAEAHRLRAYFAVFQGDGELGLREINRALELAPNSAQALLDRAWFHKSGRAWQAAIDDCARVAKLQPRRVEPLVLSGVCHTNLGELKGALEQFERAKALDPKDPTVYGNLADAYMRSERYSEALEAMKTADALHGRPRGTYGLRGRGLCYASLRDWANAEHDFRESIRLHETWIEGVSQTRRRLRPHELDVYQFLGVALLNQGRTVEAKAALERAVEAIPQGAAREHCVTLLAEIARRAPAGD